VLGLVIAGRRIRRTGRGVVGVVSAGRRIRRTGRGVVGVVSAGRRIRCIGRGVVGWSSPAPDPMHRPRGGRVVIAGAGPHARKSAAGWIRAPGQINLKLTVAKLRALAIFRLVARCDALPGGTPGNVRKYKKCNY
jgi:hypothetical protein